MEKNKELIVRPGRFQAVFNVIGCGVAVIFIGYKLWHNHSHLPNDNPGVAAIIVYTVMCLVWILLWISFFDRRPVLQMNETGIIKRRPFYVGGGVKKITWPDIQYFWVLSRLDGKGNTTRTLLLERKDGKVDFKVSLSNLDKDEDVVLEQLREYALLYNFHDLGEEKGRNNFWDKDYN